ncbi:MAG TPA: hypothetical protein V6D05_12520 [Stenomitos sp.]
MAKIAILNDTPEVVVLLSNFLTKGHHQFLKRIGTTQFTMDSLVAFAPELILVSLYRTPEAVGRPVTDYAAQIEGFGMLERVSQCPELARVPILVFAFSTKLSEMPEEVRKRVRFSAFLTFPEGLQELNPTISSLVGPAQGDMSDVEKVRRGGGLAD